MNGNHGSTFRYPNLVDAEGDTRAVLGLGHDLDRVFVVRVIGVSGGFLPDGGNGLIAIGSLLSGSCGFPWTEGGQGSHENGVASGAHCGVVALSVALAVSVVCFVVLEWIYLSIDKARLLVFVDIDLIYATLEELQKSRFSINLLL